MRSGSRWQGGRSRRRLWRSNGEATDERSPRTGWHEERRVRPHGRWHARAVGRQRARISAGWEIYHVKGSPVDPDRLYASQSSGWFGQVDPALGRRRADVGGRWATRSPTRACPARTSGTTARRTRGSSSACGTSSRRRRPGHGLRRCRGRRALPLDRRRADLAASSRACASTAPDRNWQPGAGGHVPAHRSSSTPPTRRGCSSRSRPRARSAPTTAAPPGSPINRGLRSRVHPRSGRRGRALRAPHRDAPVAARRRSSCRSTGT